MKSKIIKIVGAIVVLAAIVGGYSYPHITQLGGASSSAGASFNTAKIATIEFSLATANSTSTSILNTDGSDRIIESVKYSCPSLGTSFTGWTGAGLTNLLFNAGTTSTSGAQVTSGRLLINAVISTTTQPITYLSSTTPGISGVSGNDWVRVWNSGSYFTVTSNATNTATCLVGVSYLAS